MAIKLYDKECLYQFFIHFIYFDILLYDLILVTILLTILSWILQKILKNIMLLIMERKFRISKIIKINNFI